MKKRRKKSEEEEREEEREMGENEEWGADGLTEQV